MWFFLFYCPDNYFLLNSEHFSIKIELAEVIVLVIKKLNNMKFRTKLLLSYIIVIILCIVVFGICVFSSFSKKFEEEISNNVTQILTLAIDNTTNHMNSIEQILFSVQANTQIEKIISAPQIMSAYREIATLETALQSIDPLRTTVAKLTLYVANRDNYPNTFDSPISSTSIIENEIWYRNTVEKAGDTYWDIMDSSDANSVMCVARAFIDTRTHEVLGVIRADVSLPLFTDNISKISLGKNGKLFIVHNNHIINTWNDSYINGFVNEATFINAISKISPTPQIVKVNGIKHMISSAYLKDSPLILVCASNYEEIHSDTLVMRNSVIITGFVSIAITLVLMFLLTSWLTAPIMKLTSYMEQFKSERKKVPAEMETGDEMGKLCTTYNGLLNTIESLISDVEELYKKQKVFELKALQAQINPHFLYNTLDSIHWMARAHNAKDISKMVSALGTFFRHSLNKGYEYTTIENEIKQIISYTDIQKMRFDDKFDIIFDTDEDLLKYTIIKLSIQPLVENCIVHGFENIDAGGIIEVKTYAEDGYIYIKVSDNGCGTDTELLNKSIVKDIDYNEPIEKYGLSNVNLRIKLYFDDSCGLSFYTNKEGGVTAVIKIQQKLHEYKAIDL